MWLLLLVVSSSLIDEYWGLREVDMLDYLRRVGNRWIRDTTGRKDPLECINEGLSGWNLDDHRVNQLIGIVCDHYQSNEQIRKDPIKAACVLFERVAGHYLANIVATDHSVHDSEELQNLLDTKIPYPNKQKPTATLRYEQLREMFPSVCDKLTRNESIPYFPTKKASRARESCRLLIVLVGDYLSVVHDQLGMFNQMFWSSSYPGQLISYDLVKTMMPMVCDHHDLKHVLSCRDFEAHTVAVLRLPEEKNKFKVYELRAFIAHTCNKKEGNHLQDIKVACRDLLKENMEHLLG